jgi:uncharacterized repeat protein (TIGR01451 family)
MKKTLLYSIIALTLVLGLILPMTVPVMASQIGATKERNPDEAPYEAGETIHFVMTVTNPGNNTATNTLTRIWDTLPDGTVVDFLYAGSPYGTQLVQTPGNTTTFYLDYVVDCDDMEYSERLGYWIVRNSFQAEGYDTAADDVNALVTSNTEVIPCEAVGGEAFPIGKPSILAPWMVLGAAMVAGAVILARRRRHVRS